MPMTEKIIIPNVMAEAIDILTTKSDIVLAALGNNTTVTLSYLATIDNLSTTPAHATITTALVSDALTTTTTIATTTAAAAAAATSTTTAAIDCPPTFEEFHESIFNIPLAVPEWEALLTAVVLTAIIVLTVVGNILVILSVFTYKPLRIVQNFFIVSLAVADLTVALLVLPFNVAYSILGRWEFGIHLCKMWLTCDIMCCTSSILNLCAIALDRYWAITDPINYAQKRTVGRVLLLIAGVWLLSLLISSPPLLGWNDWPEEFTSATPCELNSDPGYVIYSSLGSFFIPLAIMTIVYIEIYIATRRRLRERAKASKITTIALKTSDYDAANNISSASKCGSLCENSIFLSCCCRSTTQMLDMTMVPTDQDSLSSETGVGHYDETVMQQQDHQQKQQQQQQQQQQLQVIVVAERKKSRRAIIKDSIKHGKARGHKQLQNTTTNITQSIKDQTADSVSLATARTASISETACHELKAIVAQSKSYTNLQQQQQQQQQKQEQHYQQQQQGQQHEAIGDQGAVESTISSSGGKNDNSDENNSLRNTPPESAMLATATSKKSSGVYQFIEEKQKISLSKERRAARTLGIIMGVFVICWLPFFLMYVILPFCSACCPTSKFKNFITWLGYINSGLNPVIYTIFNLDYRRAFKKLLGIN